MMHEDSPKMSVTQGLTASTSQPNSDIVLEGNVEYELSSTEPKPNENIQMDLKIPYVDPLNGTSSPSDRDNNEPLAKKCKHCDIMDFRLQNNKHKLGEILLEKNDLCEKMFTLEKKKKKLLTIIATLLELPSKNQTHGSDSSLSDDEDKDTADHRLGDGILASKLWLW